MPIRIGYAKDVYIVTSGEMMSMYAASNIASAVRNFRTKGYAQLGGLIVNAKGITNETEKVSALCAEINTEIVQIIPRCNAVQEAPEIILLDEPTTYLDICYQLEVLELVRHLNRAYAMTIVMVLHDINQAAQYSDIVYMMKDGEIYNTGAPKDIFLPESFTDVFRVEMRTLTDRNNEYYVPQRMVRRREENV